MRVALINYDHDRDLETPEALLDRYRTLRDWADGLERAGAEVHVVQGFRRSATFARAGVTYHFVAGSFSPRLQRWRTPFALHREVVELCPDVVHLNGLMFGLQARHLRRACGVPLIVQHHAEAPSRRLAGRLQAWGLASADAFFFSGRELARPWIEAGRILPRQEVFAVMEGTSRLEMSARATARALSGLDGEPLFLWVGHLDRNKDPLTVLDGFSRLLEGWPQARLAMVFRRQPLRSEIDGLLARDSRLGEAVRLLGPVPYEAMAPLFNSADYFVLGSHREGSGYALMDALACGAVPIVTDIPSFRHMTDGGAVGALWPAGDSASLSAAAEIVLRRPLAEERRATRALFEERLCVERLGHDALAAYRAVGAGRRVHTSVPGS